MARKKQYDAKALFLGGLMSFGRLFVGAGHKTYSIAEAAKRRKSHAQFKAQCAARREQRRLSAA